MTDSELTDKRPVTLPLVLCVAVAAGAIAGGAVFGLLRAIDATTPASASLAREQPRDAPPDADASHIAGASTNASRMAELADVRDALVTAEAERSQLAGTVLSLNRRAEALETRLATLNAEATSLAIAEDAEPAVDPVAEALADALDAEGALAGGDADSSPTDSLVAAGLDPASAADIRRRRDEFQLARLELIDLAAREGWEDSSEFTDRLDALEASRPKLRDELGDEAYDRYLHEEGSRNRVGIESVISGSVAAQVGLVQGDVVMSYAGTRVFRTRELQAATREGERGEFVQVSVLRDGEIVAVDVPRGPLGVTLTGLRRPPN